MEKKFHDLSYATLFSHEILRIYENYENYTKIYKVRIATTKISSKSVKLFNSRNIEKQNSTMGIDELYR